MTPEIHGQLSSRQEQASLRNSAIADHWKAALIGGSGVVVGATAIIPVVEAVTTKNINPEHLKDLTSKALELGSVAIGLIVAGAALALPSYRKLDDARQLHEQDQLQRANNRQNSVY